MRRRACIEWLGHKEVRVTTFSHQRTINPTKLSDKVGLDLVTMKTTGEEDMPILELLRQDGTGDISDPCQLIVMARTEKDKRDRIHSFNIHDGREQVIQVDFPDEKPVRRR